MGDPDTDKIIGPLLKSDRYRLRKDVLILSTSTGDEIPGRSLGQALQQIVWDILREPLRWSTVTRAVVSKFTNQDAVIISAGPVRAATSLHREMTNAGVKVMNISEMQPSATSQSRNTAGDIAIVGIAGRLPGGETLEEIWANLAEGKDLHKEVSTTSAICNPSFTLYRYPRIGSTWTLTVTHLAKSRIRLSHPMAVSWTAQGFLMLDSSTCLRGRRRKPTRLSAYCF